MSSLAWDLAEQGSDEWHAARCGKFTASRAADGTAKIKSGAWAASRKNYMAELTIERLTGEKQDMYQSAAMAWGTEMEPHARTAYEAETGELVMRVGFIVHPTIPMSGASPDGLVSALGLVEFKCPNSATHIQTLLTQKIDQKYILQMQWQMACTGAAWCDFVSYDPRMPEHLRLWIHRVPRDEEIISGLTTEIQEFLVELDGQVERLLEMAA